MSEQQLVNTNLAVERFRILVIGNANAGKTTILQKVCHAQGRKPVYFDAKGNELEINSALQPSTSCGEHNIEHQYQYPTAHGFIFHDSRGFEAGGADELKGVEKFVQSRAEKKDLKDQLHAIWYCLTTSNDRPMTEAQMSLFKSGTGNVPVIAIFTKMDALDEEARNQLMWEEIPLRNVNEQVPIRAKAIFQEKYLRRLQEVKHKPRYVVQLRDMDKEGTDCNELIVRTSQALDGETLKLFCLSILRNDLEFCIKGVINQIIIPTAEETRESGSFSYEQANSLFCDVMYCFPHMLPSFDTLINDMDKNALAATDENVGKFRLELEIRRLGFGAFRLELEIRRLEIRLRRGREELGAGQSVFSSQEEDDYYLQQCFENVFPFMPPQASYQLQAIWIGLMAEAVADLCLFTSLPRSHNNFRKALDFCLNAPSYPKLTSAMEQESSITDANVVLDILKENRHNYKLSRP